MYTEGLEQWMRMTKTAALPIHDFNKTVLNFYTSLGQQTAEIASQHFERMADQFQRLSTVKRPDEFFNLQRECLNENLSASMEYMQKIMKTSMENMEKFTKFLGPLSETLATSQSTKTDKEKVHR